MLNVFDVQTDLVLGRNATVQRPSDEGDFFDAFRGRSRVLTPPFFGTSLSMVKSIQYTRSLLEPGSVSVKLGPLPWILSVVALEPSRTRPREQLGLAGSRSFLRTSLKRLGMVECGRVIDSEVTWWLRRATF